MLLLLLSSLILLLVPFAIVDVNVDHSTVADATRLLHTMRKPH